MSYWIRSPISECNIPRRHRWRQWYYRTFRRWTFHRWIVELRRYESTGMWPHSWIGQWRNRRSAKIKW